MTFTSLSPDLEPTAEAAARFFRRTRGAKGFRYEAPVNFDPKIDSRLGLRPTLQGTLPDNSLLCVEVSLRAYSPSLDTFVVEACNSKYPILLFVAIPRAKDDPDFAANLKNAKSRGVGVIAFDQNDGGDIMCEAVALSLFGVRHPDPKEFPSSQRQVVATAQATFCGGNPVLGCQQLHQAIEDVSRGFAIRSRDKGWWRSPRAGERAHLRRLDTEPWAKAMEDLQTFLDGKYRQTHFSKVTPQLIGSTMGVTTDRNLTSHRPRNARERRDRDRRLRTVFESAADLLRQWCIATRGIR